MEVRNVANPPREKAPAVAAKRVTLCMDADLFERVSQSAKTNRRSVAKEVEQAVSEYLTNHEPKRSDRYETDRPNHPRS